VQAVEAVLAEGQLDHQAQGDPVGAEAQGLVVLGGQHRVEEDAAEGDPGAALVAEGVVGDQPDAGAWDEGSEQLDEEDAADLVPVPGGLAEQAEGLGAVQGGCASGGRPDAAEGAAAQADDPGGDHTAEGGEGLAAEANPQGL